MILVRGLKKIKQAAHGTVVTMGNFDGVHLGHQALIRSLKDKATELKLPLAVVLFEPQPAEFFFNHKAPARLTTLREKIKILKALGVNFIYCLKFDEKFSKYTPTIFIKNLLIDCLNTKYLSIGEDFRFGYKRLGDVSFLRKSLSPSCEVHAFTDFKIDELRVSSTIIRESLQVADFTRANTFLGRRYSICGRVVRGDGNGKTLLGIPTANIKPNRQKMPLKGVFVVYLTINGQSREGVVNIGSRPTIDGIKEYIEAHIFDFSENIYGQIIEIFFLHKLRDEIKFPSLESLVKQINKDINEARTKLSYNRVEHGRI